MKPRQVMFYPHVVKSFDALGEEIPELSGPYSPELKARIEEASDEHTLRVDVDADTMKERYADIVGQAVHKLWKAQPENTVGGWCVTVSEVPGTPADGNPPVVDFASEEIARHVAEVHNAWVTEWYSTAEAARLENITDAADDAV